MKDTVLVFPGQGSQKAGMGRDLYANFNSAKHIFEEVDNELKRDISSLILHGSDEDLLKTENAQIALLVVSVCAFRVLEQEFGNAFTDKILCLVGHSVGEYTAAYLAGFLSLKDTIQVLDVRSSGMAKCASDYKGAMFAFIGTDRKIIDQIVCKLSLSGMCCIANDNGGGQIVISLEDSLVEPLANLCHKMSVRSPIRLKTSGAFHSPFMKKAQASVFECMQNVKFSHPRFPVIFNASAQVSSNPIDARDLLVKQISSVVRWRESIESSMSFGAANFLELGSGNVLSNLIRRIAKNATVASVNDANSVRAISSLMLPIAAEGNFQVASS